MTFYFEGGIVSFVRHLNRNRTVVHERPFYVLARDPGLPGRGRAAVQRHLRRIDPHLRQQHQHGRRRHAPVRLQVGADADDQRLRQAQRLPQGRRDALRRGRARGADGDRLGQAGRAAVRGADQGQARQRRGRRRRADGRQRGARRLPGGEPAGRPAHHREVPHRRPRPRSGAQGARAGPAQGRPRQLQPARQAGRLHRARPGRRPSSTSSRATRPAGSAKQGATAASRRSCRCEARSSTSRRRASTRCCRTTRSGR